MESQPTVIHTILPTNGIEADFALKEPLLHEYFALVARPEDWQAIQSEIDQMDHMDSQEQGGEVVTPTTHPNSMGRLYLNREIYAAYPMFRPKNGSRGLRSKNDESSIDWMTAYPTITALLASISPHWRELVVKADQYNVAERFADSKELETSERLHLASVAISVATIELLLDSVAPARLQSLWTTIDVRSPTLLYAYLLGRNVIPSATGLTELLRTGDVSLATIAYEKAPSRFEERNKLFSAVLDSRSVELMRWFLNLPTKTQLVPSYEQVRKIINHSTDSYDVMRLLLETKGRHADLPTLLLPDVIENGNKRLLRLLLDNGADPFSQFLDGETTINSFDYAARLGRSDLLSLLLERYGDQLDKKDVKRLKKTIATTQ